jgi:hypothetical protein
MHESNEKASQEITSPNIIVFALPHKSNFFFKKNLTFPNLLISPEGKMIP